MSWISQGFLCGCGHETIALCDRTEPTPEVHPCEECGALAPYKLSAAIMTVALPDGTKRFQHLRETRKLQKIKKKAFYKRDKDTYLRSSIELAKVK